MDAADGEIAEYLEKRGAKRSAGGADQPTAVSRGKGAWRGAPAERQEGGESEIVGLGRRATRQV